MKKVKIFVAVDWQHLEKQINEHKEVGMVIGSIFVSPSEKTGTALVTYTVDPDHDQVLKQFSELKTLEEKINLEIRDLNNSRKQLDKDLTRFEKDKKIYNLEILEQKYKDLEAKEKDLAKREKDLIAREKAVLKKDS